MDPIKGHNQRNFLLRSRLHPPWLQPETLCGCFSGEEKGYMCFECKTTPCQDH
jgi:hypothetical protein